MKRLSMLIVLVALLGINVFAQTTRSSQISKILGPAKPSLLGTAQRPTDCDTFANLCEDDTLVIYSLSPGSCAPGDKGGYVTGHNCYGDKSKADIFLLPGETIKGLLLYFGVAKAANTTDKFTVRIWDNNGLFGDGSPGAPGTVLASKQVTYNQAKADVLAEELTYVEFTTPVAIPADSIFYAGIDYTYKAGDTLALVVTQQRDNGLCEGINTSVERYSDNTWHTFTESWGLNVSQLILPITCRNVSCIITVTPSAPSICKGKSVTLTASGSSGYMWAPAAGLNTTTGATVIAKPTSTTTYTVTGDGGACSQTVTVTVNSTPTATVTASPCQNGKVLLTRNGTPTTGVKYQWYKGTTPIAGATNATYQATTTGSYKVKVTIIATGCNKTSPPVNVTVNCKMAEGAGMQFNADAYPNPFSHSVTLNISTISTELANVKLMDFSGRVVREFKNVDPSAPFEINEDLAPGVYFVKVNQGTNEKMIKVVKD
ncbi:MAG: T9SS type A sorting domain-containing protein [Chitinophagales bacterium]|nr:T9SS type A sorting domain-containing protein [Chitinophagales bacterium]